MKGYMSRNFENFNNTDEYIGVLIVEGKYFIQLLSQEMHFPLFFFLFLFFLHFVDYIKILNGIKKISHL